MEGDEEEKSAKFITIVAIGLQVLFIILVAVAINNIFEQKLSVSKIEVANYSEIPKTSIVDQDDEEVKVINGNIDDTKKSVMDGILYDIVLMNTDGNNIRNEGAIIREGSVHNVFIADLDIYLLNFVVDLEDIGQSYRIVYRWAENYPNKNAPANNPAIVFCLREDELLYGNFDCKDKYNGHGEDYVVYSLLKNKGFDGFYVSLFGDVLKGEPLEKIYINPIVNNEENRIEAENVLRQWLADLGFDLEDFNYEVSMYEWV